ncbi:MAG: outer membrane beta-barrel protein [Kiritimatiellae bacterium]|nr:outer membrane beta-barrel protein [Kiritimatiellia bacterium]
MKKIQLLTMCTVAAAVAAQAAEMDAEQKGFRFINDRLTFSPYVALSYTYDSNIDSSKHSKSGSQWVVNPGIVGVYKDDNWKIDGQVWYQYHAYNRYTSQLNSSSFGEKLSLDWQNAKADEAGWFLKMAESFEQIAQDDDMTDHDGRGIGRDRKQFKFDAILERRVNESLHAGILGNYYYLDYDNDVEKYSTLYGWKRLSLGGQVGYTVNKWMDLIVASDYQWFWQDNDKDSDYHTGDASRRGKRVSSDSRGWSVMGGIQTHATEKLSYRVLAGWSRFEYGNGVDDIDGWTYQVSSKWQIDDENTTSLMLLGSSYYQPSERECGSALKVYTVSLGLAKGLVRNKLRATFDLAYRKETHEYTEYKEDDYDEDIYTARVGLVYQLNRMFSIFGRVEYQTEETSSGGPRSHEYDYDRWRGTVGVRLSY